MAVLMAGGPCLLHSTTGACLPLPWGVAPESPLRGRSPTWLQTSPRALLREVPSVTGQRSRGPGSPLRLHGERAQKSRSRLCSKGVRSREVPPLTPERLGTCCIHSSKESLCRRTNTVVLGADIWTQPDRGESSEAGRRPRLPLDSPPHPILQALTPAGGQSLLDLWLSQLDSFGFGETF